jgi:hypothetical protein
MTLEEIERIREDEICTRYTDYDIFLYNRYINYDTEKDFNGQEGIEIANEVYERVGGLGQKLKNWLFMCGILSLKEEIKEKQESLEEDKSLKIMAS